LFVVTANAALAGDVVPFASFAFTVNEYAVPGVRPPIVALVPVTDDTGEPPW
jgi:hypothetical protein